MKRAHTAFLLLLCTFAEPCKTGILLAGTSAQLAAHAIPTGYVPAPKADPQHVQWLDQRRPELDRVLDLYNYNLKAAPWDFKELRSHLLSKDAIFRFESIEVSEGASVFVAIIPSGSAEINVIPLWYHGLRFAGAVDLDPHNIAIFNALESREQPALKIDSDCIDLAVLYLHLFEAQPQILQDKASLATLGQESAQKSESFLPNVERQPSGGFDVHLFEKIATDTFAEFSFSFDKNGLLRDLTKHTGTKAELFGRG